jgi:hypothetical protein
VRLDPRVADIDEAARVVRVVADEPFPKIEDVDFLAPLLTVDKSE